MKSTRYFKPYGLDLSYELNTYKHIGKDYGDIRTANLTLGMNIARHIRKNIVNKNEKKYKICDKYTEWEKYVIDKFPHDICNKKDLLHFVCKNRRYAELNYELIKVVAIPIYIAMLSIDDYFYPISQLKFMFIMISIFIIVIASTAIVTDAKNKINFYEDYCCLINKIINDDLSDS